MYKKKILKTSLKTINDKIIILSSAFLNIFNLTPIITFFFLLKLSF